MRPSLSNAALAALALALSLGAAGCRPDIGESCSNSIECSSQGDRICDTSLPSGYCTIYNCEADGCPDESICVAFARSEDPYADTCQVQGWARFERTFCLGSCSNDGDCRGGYLCARPDRLSGDYGGRILDVDPSKPGVCVALGSQGPGVPKSTDCPPPPPACFPDYGGSGEGVCGAGGAAGAGGGGAGGAAGQSGAAGEAGAGGEGGGGAGSGGAAGSGGEAGAGGAGGEAAGAGGAGGAAGGGAGGGG